MGHKQTFCDARAMSAFNPKADIRKREIHWRRPNQVAQKHKHRCDEECDLDHFPALCPSLLSGKPNCRRGHGFTRFEGPASTYQPWFRLARTSAAGQKPTPER